MKQDEFESLSIFEQATITPAYQLGFQAGAASRDAEVQRLQSALADAEALECGTAEKCDQLRAQINVLREAATPFTSPDVVDETSGTIPLMGALEKAISPTPEQSLAEYRNKVIEDCAVKADALANCEENTDGYRNGAAWCAEAIRAMKEQL